MSNPRAKADKDNLGVEAKIKANFRGATQVTRLSNTSRAQTKKVVLESFGNPNQVIWPYFSSPTKKKLVGICMEAARLQKATGISLLTQKISNNRSFKVNQVIKHHKKNLVHMYNLVRLNLTNKCPWNMLFHDLSLAQHMIFHEYLSMHT